MEAISAGGLAGVAGAGGEALVGQRREGDQLATLSSTASVICCGVTPTGSITVSCRTVSGESDGLPSWTIGVGGHQLTATVRGLVQIDADPCRAGRQSLD